MRLTLFLLMHVNVVDAKVRISIKELPFANQCTNANKDPPDQHGIARLLAQLKEKDLAERPTCFSYRSH